MRKGGYNYEKIQKTCGDNIGGNYGDFTFYGLRKQRRRNKNRRWQDTCKIFRRWFCRRTCTVELKAVDAFNEQSDTVQVEMTGLPGDNYNEKIMTSLNSKTAPDCFYSEEATFGELEKSGMLLDLTEFLENEDSSLKQQIFQNRFSRIYVRGQHLWCTG